ncbi:MAG: SH3 domain-containing protein [Hyphomicrobiaceae bacterium]|nr:SH3 domain-containing protein [Hyphomicrobiaceae bacterium]
MMRQNRNIFSAVAVATVILCGPVSAADPVVPVMEIADGDFDTCAFGKVSGLNPRGDNFLAVRAGPGTSYRMLDKIRTDDKVWLLSNKGDWIGIVYGVDEVNCSPVKADRPYEGPGKTGWVHRKFITLLAG